MDNLMFRAAAWVESRFGREVLMNRQERARRLVEEAIELAQAEKVDSLEVLKIAARVYDRPPGEPRQEFGGVLLTALAYSYAAQCRTTDVALDEIVRVERVPAEISRAKHNAKAAAGTAIPSEEP